MKKLTREKIGKIFLDNPIIWGCLFSFITCLVGRDWSEFFFRWIAFGAGLFVADLLKAVVRKPENRLLALLFRICWILTVTVIYFLTSLLIYGFTPKTAALSIGVFFGFLVIDCAEKGFDDLGYIIKHYIIYRPETETAEMSTDTGTLKVSVTRWRKRGKHEEKHKM